MEVSYELPDEEYTNPADINMNQKANKTKKGDNLWKPVL